MDQICRLCDIAPGEQAYVYKIDGNDFKRRFYDIGLVHGTAVKCVGISPGKDMRAFMIRGAVIGLRNEDSYAVSVVKRGNQPWD